MGNAFVIMQMSGYSYMRDVIAIVLGWNYSTALGVVRSLGMGGFRVHLYFIAKKKGGSKVTASSKYLENTIEHIGRDDENIIEELSVHYKDNTEKLVLVPTDDYTSSLIDRYYDRLAERFLMPHIGDGEQGAITRLMDKSTQTGIGNQFGLKTIHSHKVFLPEEDDIALPEGIKYPCFVKPLVSLNGRKTEMQKCDSAEQLEKHLEYMRERMGGRVVLIQDYLNIQEEYSISGLCLDQDVVLPALLKRLFVGKHERGVTIVGELVPIATVIDFADKLKQLLKSLHFAGLFCIDLVRANDAIYFSEINFRSAGSLYGYVKAGANLPALLVNYLTGKKYDLSSVNVRYGTRFFYDKVAWEDLLLGHCTRKDFRNYAKVSDFSFLKDKDDPQPGELLYKQMRWSYAKKCVKSVLKCCIPKRA